MSDERAVQQVLARYVRATDNRDGTAMAALFVAGAVVEVIAPGDDGPTTLAELVGAEAIGAAVAGMMAPHPPRGWSHHTTHDPIIEVDQDEATLDAQFVVFNTRGDERPAGGWPADAGGAQGTVVPVEAGSYRPRLRRIDGAWKIVRMQIVHDLPFAIPGAA